MLFEEKKNCGDPYRGGWYRNINPNEHTYTPGYGFSPKPPALMERRLIASYSCATGLCLLGFFFLGMALPGIFFRVAATVVPAVIYHGVEEALIQLSVLAGSIVALALPFWIYRLYVKIPRENALPARRVAPGLVVSAVCVALAVSVVGMTASSMVESLFSTLGVRFDPGNYAVPLSPVATVLYALNMTLVPALFEEFAFRGVLMQSLRRFGDGFALLVSALLFSLVHVLPAKFPNALLVGLVTGYFVMFTGSIWVGVAIHFAHNALLLAAMFALGDVPGQTLILNGAMLVYLMAGFVALLTLMRRYDGLFSLHPSATINGEGQKLGAFFGTAPMAVLAVVVIVMAAGHVITG